MARTEIDRADARFGWTMAAPALAILFLVILFPVFWALFTSVHDYTLINPHFDSYSGLANFRRAIADPEFRHSLGLTAFFVVAVVVLEFLLGFLVALILRHPALPAADEPGRRRPDLAHVPSSLSRNRQLPARCRRHRAGQLAGQHQGGAMDHHHGRHLASGVLHGRPAARGAFRLAARAL
jgi:hypothetical protein